MKRLVLIAGLAIAMALAVVGVGTAETPGSVKPVCADILGGDATFTGTLANGGFATAAPSCRSVRYTMVVYLYDASGSLTTIVSQTLRGDNTNARVGPFNLQTPTAPYACIYFISYKGDLDGKSAAPLDMNPDAGCPSTIDVTTFTNNPPNVFVADAGAPGGGSGFPG